MKINLVPLAPTVVRVLAIWDILKKITAVFKGYAVRQVYLGSNGSSYTRFAFACKA